MSFLDDVLADVSGAVDIDDYVGYWNDGAGEGLPLHAYLGLTFDEYRRWAEDPAALDAILDGYRARRWVRARDLPATDNFAHIIAERRRRHDEIRRCDEVLRRCAAIREREDRILGIGLAVFVLALAIGVPVAYLVKNWWCP